MKHNIIYLTFMAMLLTVACAKEELQDGVQPRPENAVNFSGSMTLPQDAAAAPDTRTSYADGENAVSAEWEAEDRIGLFCETGGELVAANFGYRNTTAGKQAVFDYILPGEVVCWSGEAAAGHDFYAYYPYAESEDGSPADPERVPVQLPAVQNFDSLDPLGELSDLDFMYASALGQTQEQVGEEGMVNLDFQHLFSILQVKITTTRFAKVDALIFRCTEDGEPVSYGEGTTVNLRTGEISPAGTSNEIRLVGSLNTMISDYVTFNMLVSPGHEGKQFDIVAVINGNEYKAAVGKAAPEGGFKAGRTYVVTVDGMEVDEADGEPVVDLSAEETANCYYVTEPGQLYRFNATVKGNGQLVDGLSETEFGIEPAKVIVLWYTRVQEGYGPWTYTEPPVSIDGISLESDGYVYFRTPEPFIAGNMVLAVLDSDVDYDAITVDSERRLDNANILWSWNIVFAEGYDPDDDANQIIKGGYMIMSRNLGAVIDPEDAVIGGSTNGIALAATSGNVYQWGRKDPFPGPADYLSGDHTYMTSLWFAPAFTPVTALQVGPYEAHGRVTEGNIFANNTDDLCIDLTGRSLSSDQIFDIETASPYLWIRNDNGYIVPDDGKFAWGNTPDDLYGVGLKTIYDPCPPGWKVMSLAAWNAITENGGAVAEVADIISGDATHGVRGLWFEDSWFPYTGGLVNHNASGSPDGGTQKSYATYWFDSSYDGMHAIFNGVNKNVGDQVAGTTQTWRVTGSSSIRCMKVIPGPVAPDGEEIDPIGKEEWK